MGATGHPTSHPCGRSSSLPTTLASDVRRPGLRSTRSRYRLDRPHAGSDPVGPTATAQQGSAEPRGIDALGSRVPRPPIPTPCGARAGGEPATRVSLPLCPRLRRWGRAVVGARVSLRHALGKPARRTELERVADADVAVTGVKRLSAPVRRRAALVASGGRRERRPGYEIRRVEVGNDALRRCRVLRRCCTPGGILAASGRSPVRCSIAGA